MATMDIPKTLTININADNPHDRQLVRRVNAIQKRLKIRKRSDALRKIIDMVHEGGASGVAL
jgi:hypothetical protein